MKKPDYKNWVPKSMVIGLGAATAASASLSVLFIPAIRKEHDRRKNCGKHQRFQYDDPPRHNAIPPESMLFCR